MRNTIRIMQYAILIAMVLVLVGCGVSKSQHEVLEEKYAKVQKEITGFNEQVKAMQVENGSLKKEVEMFKDEIAKVTDGNDVMKKDYQKLLKENQILKREIAKKDEQIKKAMPSKTSEE